MYDERDTGDMAKIVMLNIIMLVSVVCMMWFVNYAGPDTKVIAERIAVGLTASSVLILILNAITHVKKGYGLNTLVKTYRYSRGVKYKYKVKR